MRRISLALSLYALACSGLFAQNVAQINGVVRDSSGLAVPGAQITVTQTDTGLTRTTQSANDGAYALPALPTGPYRLEVKKEGFMGYAQSGIVLQVDSNPAIEVGLKVGSVSEQVNVEAAASMVETQSTGVGQVINQDQVVDLPLNGREATQLIFLAGAATTGTNSLLNTVRNAPNETLVVLAGATVSSLTYLLDGSIHEDPYNGLNLEMPFPDALQEFKIESNALAAQYGYHAEGAVNAVTKSGTNTYHGDAFEFVRNTDLDAKDYFASVGDGLKRNQFGGTLGGPIKKNKAFFFAGYQNTTIRQVPANTITFLPTEAMIGGNFQTYAASKATGGCQAGKAVTLPAPFVNNIAPPSLLNASAVKSMTYYPPPPDQNCGQETYTTLTNSSEYMGVSKVDYRFNDKHSMFGRYYGEHFFSPPSYTGSLESTILSPQEDILVQSGAFGDTYIFGPNTINSFHANVMRDAKQGSQVPEYNCADIGIQGVYRDPRLGTYCYFTVSGAFQSGGSAATGWFLNGHSLSDDLSLIRGSHQFGFGVQWIRYAQNAIAPTWVDGEFVFNGQYTGLADADFMTGQMSSFTQLNMQVDAERHQYVGLYAQDSWKLRPNLSVNYGLRWEPFMGPSMRFGEVSSFNMADFLSNVHSTVFPNAPAGTFFPGDSQEPQGKRPTDIAWKDFAPRLGVVWDPKGDGKMTVRASWGMFYDLPTTIAFYDYATEPPWGGGVTITSPPGGFSNPYLGYPGGDPFPLAITPNLTFPTSGTYLSTPSTLTPTYVEQWNLTVQRQIKATWLFSASYLGNDTVHLWGANNLDYAVDIPGNCTAGQYGLTAPGACSTTSNTASRRILTLDNPAQGGYYGAIYEVNNGGTASYNAMLLSINHRMGSHFTLLANYTWAHCIADPFAEYLGNTQTTPNNRRFDRGDCTGGSDVRNNANISMVAESPRFSNRLVQMFAGNWRLSPIFQLHSGTRFSLGTGVDNALDGLTSRPNVVLSNPYCATPSVHCYLNSAAFAAPAAGTFGNEGVDTIVGPAYFDVDLALSREFVVREKQRLQIRAEVFNIQNRVNLSTPNTTLNSATFGQITADVAPRIMQGAIKYTF